MAERPLQLEEVGRLTGLLLEGALGDDDRRRLEDTLLADPAALEYYQNYVDVHCLLHWQHGLPEERGARDEGRGMAGTPAVDEHEPRSVSLKSRVPDPESPVPPIVLDLSAPLPSPLSPFPSFVGGPVFSYLVATLILGVMLLGAWAYKITHYQQSAEKNSPSNTQPEMQFVGQITGLKDCRWADPQTETYPGASVPLNRKYALAAGLMEITYKSGARVILEGPCTYEVDSRAGGYLSLGKLTARVEKEGETRRGGDKERSAVGGQRSEHYPLSTIHYPLFSVRTPTAIVTDLGTEFGVEVSAEGNTTSHVFRGSVNVQVVGDSEKQEVVLRENESARVEKNVIDGEPRVILSDKVGAPPKFVRELIKPPQLLDLLDVVAGGNGWGRRREHGIDATSGEVDFKFAEKRRAGDGQYSSVAWNKLIDGVFIPDGRSGTVRLDSAGHVFNGFPATSNITYGALWSRAAEIDSGKDENDLKHWIYLIGRCKEFTPEDRGLLGFCPNVGLTFDLEAVRAKNPGLRPSRFRAVLGMGDVRPYYPSAGNLADFWVFIDGRLKLRRARLCPQDGAVNIDVEIGAEDRFLTLVSTNAGDSTTCDWVVLGDPALQIVPLNSEKK